MMNINPCSCGGLPFVSPYFAPYDTYEENEMFLVRCMVCGNVGGIEYTEDDAIIKWNEKNYIAGW